jgi:hypothetical protein
VTVLDFIGEANRRFRFDLRYRAATGATRTEVARQIAQGFPFLTAGWQRSFASDPSLPHHPRGAQLAMLYVRVYARGFPPPASLPSSGTCRGSATLERLDAALTRFLEEVRLVA